jgi:hypothetical protein
VLKNILETLRLKFSVLHLVIWYEAPKQSGKTSATRKRSTGAQRLFGAAIHDVIGCAFFTV